MALAPLDHVAEGDLSEKIRSHKPARIEFQASGLGDFLPMDEVERRYIARVLDAVGGNKTLAARRSLGSSICWLSSNRCSSASCVRARPRLASVSRAAIDSPS